MKKWLKSIFLSIVICNSVVGLGPFGSFFDKEWETGRTFASRVEKSIEDLKKRKKEGQDALSLYKGLLSNAQKSLTMLKRMIRVRPSESDFVGQQLSISTKIVQILSEIIKIYTDLKEIIDDHIKLLQEYKADPEFRNKGLYLEPKSIYSIEDFQKINGISLNYDHELKGLEDRLKKILSDYDTLRKNQMLAQQELDEKKREQKELRVKAQEERTDRKKLTLSQQGELLDLEERLLQYKKALADAKVKEADAKIQFLEQNTKIIKLQLEVLEKEEEHARQELRIDRKDLAAAETALKQQSAESNKVQEDYATRIENLNVIRQNELNEIAQLRPQIGKIALETLYDWTYQPFTVGGWNSLIKIGSLHNHIALDVDASRELLNAGIEQEKAKVSAQEVNNAITQSWYNLISGAFDSQLEQINKELKRYENLKAVLEASIASLADKKAAASAMLTHNVRLTEAMKARLKVFKEQKTTTFKDNPREFEALGEILQKEAFVNSQVRGETLAQLIELYLAIIQTQGLTIKKIDMMISVLKAKLQWQGAPPLWKGIKKFFPDMAKFFFYLTGSGQLNKSSARVYQSFLTAYKGFSENPSSLIALILYALIAGLVYFLLRLYLPSVAVFLTTSVPQEYGLLHSLSNFLALVLHFLVRSLKVIYPWAIGFYFVFAGYIDTYWSVIFYLISIPLWLYYVNRFINYARIVNSSRGYLFVSKEYQKRFFTIISTLLYATAVIFFLREALLRAFPKSDAAHILRALNFMLLQISLILIIRREQVLQLIPQTTPLWRWIFEQVERYYYFLLTGVVFIIVMSNPYIGYGPHFFYVISRIGLVLFLVPLFIALHAKIKNWLGSFFFYADEEGVKERFIHARSTYGLVVIATFFLLSCCAILIAFKIWGYSIGFDKIHAWLGKEIDWLEYTSSRTGRIVKVTAFDVGKVFLYILGGFALASFLNRFVLRRMFDLLLINVGVQSVVLSLTRYAIIVTAIVLGLQSIGLSNSFYYVLVVIAGLGVAGKEVITDFIGYFIILIQRPIKIGDYVRLDDELSGTVRYLTLRSIIMRKNNSVTVIIPNSFILTRPVTNWNYSRTFFAFDDIVLTVAYSSDPAKVRTLLLQVLDRNINILKNPPPIVRLNDFADNGFQFIVRGFLSPDKVNAQKDIASEVRLELVRTLRAQGLDVGSPTRVLRIVQEKSEPSESSNSSD